MRKEKTMEKGKIDHDFNEGVREKKRKEKENSNIYSLPLTPIQQL